MAYLVVASEPNVEITDIERQTVVGQYATLGEARDCAEGVAQDYPYGVEIVREEYGVVEEVA